MNKINDEKINFQSKGLISIRNNYQAKIQELSSLVLSVNRESLFSNFINIDGKIDYELILKKILLPFFKMKSRILKKGTFFKIGEIEFKVNGLNPGKKGVITSKTFIHCDNYFSSNTIIERALLLTTQKYEDLNKEAFVKELLNNDNNYHNIMISKNEIIQMKQYDFYIRNCEPDSGKISSQTLISIENNEIINLSQIKIAIIKVFYYLLLGEYSRISR